MVAQKPTRDLARRPPTSPFSPTAPAPARQITPRHIVHSLRNSIRHKASEARGSQHNVDVVLYTVRSYKYSGSTSTCTVLCCVRHHVLKLATQTCTQTGSCSRLSKIVLETWLDTRQEEDFVIVEDHGACPWECVGRGVMFRTQRIKQSEFDAKGPSPIYRSQYVRLYNINQHDST